MSDSAHPAARFVDLPGRGGRMALLDFGPAGRPVDVVFSHANGFNAATYRSILAPLADELRILAVDLRGHGASELPAVTTGRGGWQEFADDLLAFLSAVTAGPVTLSGHSMGATSSLLAAAKDPARVRNLVLFDPVIYPGVRNPVEESSALVQGARRRRASFPDRAAALAAYRGRGAFKSWSETQLQDYLAGALRPGPGGELVLTCAPEWEASNYLIQNHDSIAALRDSLPPVRLLRAEHHSTAQFGDQLEAISAGGRVRVETIPGTSHFLPMERPDLVQAALRAAAAGR